MNKLIPDSIRRINKSRSPIAYLVYIIVMLAILDCAEFLCNNAVVKIFLETIIRDSVLSYSVLHK